MNYNCFLIFFLVIVFCSSTFAYVSCDGNNCIEILSISSGFTDSNGNQYSVGEPFVGFGTDFATGFLFRVLDVNGLNLDNNHMSIVKQTSIQPETTVVLFVDASDNFSLVSRVIAVVTKPDRQDYNYSMVLVDGNHYKFEFSETEGAGNYFVNFLGIDSMENSSKLSTDMYFTVLGEATSPESGIPPTIPIVPVIPTEKKLLFFEPAKIEKFLLFFPFIQKNLFFQQISIDSNLAKNCNSNNVLVNCWIDKNVLNMVVLLVDEPVLFKIIETNLLVDENNFFPVKIEYFNFGYFVVFDTVTIETSFFDLLLLNDFLFKLNDNHIKGVRLWWITSIGILFIIPFLVGRFLKKEFWKKFSKTVSIFAVCFLVLLTIAFIFSNSITQAGIIGLLVVGWIAILATIGLVWFI